LFGCDFRTSAGRCTAGIYMSFVTYEDKTIVILDTERLMSVESGNKVFDNQMATMAVLSSHLIIINHKGEINANLGSLLGITFYAKLRISKSEFKPSILFVLHDQSERDSGIELQIVKLKQNLNEETSFGRFSKNFENFFLLFFEIVVSKTRKKFSKKFRNFENQH
jgi:hypothetical protein